MQYSNNTSLTRTSEERSLATNEIISQATLQSTQNKEDDEIKNKLIENNKRIKELEADVEKENAKANTQPSVDNGDVSSPEQNDDKEKTKCKCCDC